MKRFFFIIVALAIAAVVSSTNLAMARTGSTGSHPGNKGAMHPNEPKVVNTIHPIEYKGPNKNSNGYGDGRRGRDYRNWSRYCWFPECGAYGFCSGDDGQWYYWYEPAESYLPVSRMNELRPTGAPPMTPNLPPGAVPMK